MWGMGDMFDAESFAGPLAVAQPAAVQALAAMLPAVPGQTLAQRFAQAQSAALAQARTMLVPVASSTSRSGQGRTRASYPYRPQFVPRSTPKGFHDVDFVHFYDANTTPVLGMTIGAGAEKMDIPLYLENDADFILRGIRVLLVVTSEEAGAVAARVQFREPAGGRFLSSQPPALPPVLSQSYLGQGLNVTPTGAFEFPMVPMDPEIVCPAGSAFLAYLYNPLAVAGMVSGFIAFFGVKRYANGC